MVPRSPEAQSDSSTYRARGGVSNAAVAASQTLTSPEAGAARPFLTILSKFAKQAAEIDLDPGKSTAAVGPVGGLVGHVGNDTPPVRPFQRVFAGAPLAPVGAHDILLLALIRPIVQSSSTFNPPAWP